MEPLTSPILPGAEPYFARGGATGCLVLHGFTASPSEVRWLAGHLAGAGHTVYAPRLPGHGTAFRDLSRFLWTDWYAGALDGYHLLRASCERVFVVGHSMGGLLALLLAASVPLDGVAALAVPIILRGGSLDYAGLLKYVMPYTDQTDRGDFPALVRAEQERRSEPVLGRVRYERWSTAAVAELVKLAKVTHEHLPQVQTPLLLLYSTDDRTVPISNMGVIAAGVGSTVIEQHTLSGSDHILPQDAQRETVFQLVADFVGRMG